MSLEGLLDELKLSKYLPKFKEQNVTLSTLEFIAKQGSDDVMFRQMLFNECGLTLGDYVSLITKLKPQHDTNNTTPVGASSNKKRIAKLLEKEGLEKTAETQGEKEGTSPKRRLFEEMGDQIVSVSGKAAIDFEERFKKMEEEFNSLKKAQEPEGPIFKSTNREEDAKLLFGGDSEDEKPRVAPKQFKPKILVTDDEEEEGEQIDTSSAAKVSPVKKKKSPVPKKALPSEEGKENDKAL